MQSAAVNGIDAIRDQILNESPFGDVRISDVRTRAEASFDGDDDAYVHLVVYAEDPGAGADTWPVQDVLKLRQRVLELAVESDADLPRIVVDVYPQREDEQLTRGEARDSAES
jgi:hypothetical protein